MGRLVDLTCSFPKAITRADLGAGNGRVKDGGVIFEELLPPVANLTPVREDMDVTAYIRVSKEILPAAF